MAWQNGGPQQNMGGAVAGPMPDQNGQQSAYTLQGVMRFLQMEWHSHERLRNSWDIEREEMKKRIAGLEGEARSSRSLRTVLERQIKMLEFALRKERENVAKAQKKEPVDAQDSKEYAREQLKKLKETENFNIPRRIGQFDNEIDAENHLDHGLRQEKQRDRSKEFLAHCGNEISYYVLPGIEAYQQQYELHNVHMQNGERHPSQQELHEAWAQIQAQKQQRKHQANMGLPAEVNMFTGQTDPPQQAQQYQHEGKSLARQNTRIHLASEPTEESNARENKATPNNGTDHSRRLYQDYAPDEKVESISHSYDEYGRETAKQHENAISKTRDRAEKDSGDGWDFGDAEPPQQPPPDYNNLMPQRPDTESFPVPMPSKSPTRLPGSHRRKSSSGARRQSSDGSDIGSLSNALRTNEAEFKVRFVMRGHLDVVRSVIFTGGGSPADPEFCTAGDDGTIKRWHIPVAYTQTQADEKNHDRTPHFTHRGHIGSVCCLAACPAQATFSNGGRVAGDGWIFSGGEDATVKVWERGRVDAKHSLDLPTDAVWALCVLPGLSGSILGEACNNLGGPDRVLLVAGAADGTIFVWAVTAPPVNTTSQGAGNRGARSSRRANSISAGSNFPSSPQSSVASNTPFDAKLVHRIERTDRPSPTSISALSANGENFVVAYSNASVLVFDTRTGEEIVGMASQETYDGTQNTAINAVVATSTGFEASPSLPQQRRSSMTEDDSPHGPTGGQAGAEGLVIAGYEDHYIRFFDANSGQCTYTMLAHPSSISSLSLSPDGRELVSGGHDRSLRIWSLEKRTCTHEITSHRNMRGEGVCAVVWSPDGRFVISAGGDGAVKVLSRS